ncbi:hypothetical protein [Nocardioides pantholopis]|uniref:hypothetical protein n=1 Tax=Nocardioides pantholopis TaxID=2483798 RepID=UPI000FD99E4F|nr:hypothetical protein [Nocardioides pantholopis]
MADALSLLVTTTVFLAGFMSVRIHGHLDAATTQVFRFDRKVRAAAATFDEVDAEDARSMLVQLSEALVPDRAVALTVWANYLLTLAVLLWAGLWLGQEGEALAWRPDQWPLGQYVGTAAVVAQLIVLLLCVVDYRSVRDKSDQLLVDACLALVHWCPGLLGPAGLSPRGVSYVEIHRLSDGRDALQKAAAKRRVRGLGEETSSALDLVQAWLQVQQGAVPLDHDEDVFQLDGRLAKNFKPHRLLLDAAVHQILRRDHAGAEGQTHEHLIWMRLSEAYAAIDLAESSPIQDAVSRAFLHATDDRPARAAEALTVSESQGHAPFTRIQAAKALSSLLGPYLCGTFTKTYVETELNRITFSRDDAGHPKKFSDLEHATHAWQRLEAQIRQDLAASTADPETIQRARERRVLAAVLGRELRLLNAWLSDTDVSEELRLLAPHSDRFVALRGWCELLEGDPQSAAVTMATMNRLPMVETFEHTPLMACAWAYLELRSGRPANARALLAELTEKGSLTAASVDELRKRLREAVGLDIAEFNVLLEEAVGAQTPTGGPTLPAHV